ncbi:SusC/RagA family TonB-linked outer membrane protein [Pelobium sp.]|nr:SusC/RagA family TonB-linked outer membrane protein [Pelobium sp.]MDA9554698.1 SusC/RagA family TonB-linked outer membrane protein [Pelobium sp.]
MKKKLLLLLFSLLFLIVQVFAQEKVITGTVTSADDGLPLPGVSVKIKSSNKGTQTNVDGKYIIKTKVGDILVFSFLGNLTQERTVGAENQINISLKSDTKTLSEVVVLGFGQSEQKRDLVTATQTVQGKEISDTQRENFLNALQGRVAGLSVTSTSGNPGASSSIVLRGINSIGGNNQPLFIIDGIRIDNSTFGQGALASDGPNRNSDYLNRAGDINPNDIESVTVLKGPEAAALYGSDAASGAIIITTKKGTAGSGSISYDNNFSFSNVYRFPETQKLYGRGTNGVQDLNVRSAFGPRFAAGTQIFDNNENFFRTGKTQQHNLSIDGGSEKTTFRISTQIRNSEGVFPGTSNQRVSVRLSGATKVSEKFKASGSFNYFNNQTEKNNKGAIGTFLNLLTWPADDDVRVYLNSDGSRRRLRATNDGSDTDNPFFDISNNVNKDKTNRMVASIDLSYDAFKWLNLRGLAGADFYNTLGNSLISPFSTSYQNSPLNGFNSTSGISARGILENYTDNNLLLNGSFFATAKKSIKDFRGTLALGGEAFDTKDEVNTIYGEKFYELTFNGINNTDPTTQRAKSTITQRRRLALIGRFNLNWKDMVNFQVTGRNDYSSTLPVDNRSFFYPSVGGSFEFTQLSAFKGSKVLSFGKLRASYAEVGKDAPPYKTGTNLDSQSTTGGGFQYNVFGGNAYLVPEKVKSFEVGTELQFFKGRLGLDVAYYNTRPTNQIIAPRISYGGGFVLQYINGGTIENSGVEVQLTTTPIRTKGFTWNSDINFTRARGKVVKLPADLPEYYNSDTWLYANARASLFPRGSTTSIGSYDYSRNNNGQILISPSTGLPVSNGVFVITGDRQPDFTLGLVNRFAYENISLSFLLDIRKGGDVFNGNELLLTRLGLSKRTENREQPIIIPGVLNDGLQNTATPTVNTIQVTPYYNQNFYSSASIESDFIEKNINWVRLQDFTLSYNFPASVLQRQKVFKAASVFFTGTDIFMITNYSGADPNVNGTNSSTLGSGAAGFDYGTLSTPRTFSFGLRVGL